MTVAKISDNGRAVRQGTTVVENYTEHVRKITPNG